MQHDLGPAYHTVNQAYGFFGIAWHCVIKKSKETSSSFLVVRQEVGQMIVNLISWQNGLVRSPISSLMD